MASRPGCLYPFGTRDWVPSTGTSIVVARVRSTFIDPGSTSRTNELDATRPIMSSGMEFVDLPRNVDERTTLLAFLAWQRDSLAKKCEGLSVDQLRLRAAQPSTLSLLGLVRHMAEGERGWFRWSLAGEDIGEIWCTDEKPDADTEDVDTADGEEAFATWRGEMCVADQIVLARPLDAVGRQLNGAEVSMRWILTHMIEEYSRHNGHADIIRQRIDGAIGY
jgi:uncharacterized damage-inducible protein DinB